MYIRELDRKGIAIDSIAIIGLMATAVWSINWVLVATGNSNYSLFVNFYVLFIIFGLSMLIESYYGPILIKYIYRARYEQEKKEMKIFLKQPPYPIANN